MTTICLSMIVKNEAPVIQRCLDSVRPIIDYWVIVDTGSTDGTQDIIREHLKDLPGELHERPWRDFGHNRSEALTFARPHGDYSLIIDADDALEIPDGFQLPELTADSYILDIHDTAVHYQRTQVVRNTLPWRYQGVLHEFLSCEGAQPPGHLPIVMLRNHDGARRRDPQTYLRDAEVFESALRTETSDFLRVRYTFYLAQSYRDCREHGKSLENYLKRAELGHWDEEVYVSLCEAAGLQRTLNKSPDEILATYQRAIKVCPTRAEAYHGASHYLRSLNRFAEGYEIAKPGLDLKPAGDGLFLSHWIYQYGLLDEYAVNAYWAGQYEDSLAACERLLASGALPTHHRPRIQANADFASAKIREIEAIRAEPPAPRYPVSTWAPSRAQGGTELMVEGLRSRLGSELDRIDLQINSFNPAELTGKPLVLWMHHDVDQAAVQWCRDTTLVSRVRTFVFVSYWQMERYIREFGLPPNQCVVLRNATTINQPLRAWNPGGIRRIAYVSTPFRGLDVLLDAWERLKPSDAELHIWSSRKLYGVTQDDAPYEALFARAIALPNVFYRGIVPNDQIREELRCIDYLAYPSTFAETSCLSVIEAMAAACRVICPALGALPETAAGFARIYPWQPDREGHAAVFADVLTDELAHPWEGRVHLEWEQQVYCHAFYDWGARVEEWGALIKSLTDYGRSTHVAAAVRSGLPETISLRNLGKRVSLPKNHLEYLLRMRDTQHIDPKVIYDIGACVLHWQKGAKTVWPNARFVLFEAMDEVEPIFLESGMKDYNLGVLSDVDGKQVSFYQNTEVPGGNSYYKENGEINPAADAYFNESHKRIKKALTLDTVVKRKRFPKPDLIKIDVQGAELDVLKGAENALEQCKNLILELQRVEYNKGAPLKDEVIVYLASIGYQLMNDGPFCDAGPDGDYHFAKF